MPDHLSYDPTAPASGLALGADGLGASRLEMARHARTRQGMGGAVTGPPLVLRDYQQQDIERLRDEFRKGHRNVCYQLATAGGKTVVFGAIVQSAAAKGVATLVVAHRRELVKQASQKLTWAGVGHGIQAAGLDRDHDQLVQVASIDTIRGRLDKLPKFGLIVVDECHHSRAKTWQKVLESQPQARLLGVSATPARLDGKGLGRKAGGLFDTLVCGPSMQSLVDQGYLAPTRVFIPSATIDMTGVKVRAGDWAEEELEERAGGVTGDAVKEFQALPEGTTAMAFCATVKHAEDVAQAFRDAGFRSTCVHGAMPKAERDAAIAGLADGSTQVLTSCELISEGLDVPSVSCVILLRPTKSLTMCLQQIGRGMRPGPGKTLIVLDHAKNCVAHGLPCEERGWSLDGAKKQAKEDQKPTPWACISCQTLNPVQRRTCSFCGTAKPWACKGCGCLNRDEYRTCIECGMPRPQPRRILVADDASMRELKAADKLERVIRLSYGQLLRVRRTEEELQAYAKAKGYRPGWVWHKLQEQNLKFGPDR
jgi:DNA repair protein RadD